MLNYYLLWASGEDQPGIVAGVTSALYRMNANIQDSSMMRLGSEFGILMIFTTVGFSSTEKIKSGFSALAHKLHLNLGLKKISAAQARFRKPQASLVTISVHGSDRPGIVSIVTQQLMKLRFNITDLSTHRTSQGKSPGFILLLEGEMPKRMTTARLQGKLNQLQKKIHTRITVNPITARAL